MSHVDFFFDFSSPFAFLASTRIEALAARSGATVRFKPFLLGGLFKMVGTGDIPLFQMPPVKRKYALADLLRWADFYGLPLRFPSRFPMNTVKPLRMVLEVPDAEKPALVHALFRAYWCEDRDLANDAVLAEVATAAGYEGADLVAATRTEAAKESLKAATAEAAHLGLCGAPSFRVGDLLFWGNDRMLFVEKALGGWRPQGE